jgi:hypothetical protein
MLGKSRKDLRILFINIFNKIYNIIVGMIKIPYQLGRVNLEQIYDILLLNLRSSWMNIYSAGLTNLSI